MKMARALSWRKVVLRMLHQVNEGVLQAGADLCPLVGRTPERGDCRLECRRIVTADMQTRTKDHRLLDAGLASQIGGKVVQVRTCYQPGREAHMRDHLRDGAVREQVPVGDV